MKKGKQTAVQKLTEELRAKRAEAFDANRRHDEVQRKLNEIEQIMKVIEPNEYTGGYTRRTFENVADRVRQMRIDFEIEKADFESMRDENRRLWHLVRSLTGDKTLEIPRQKIYTTAPDGSQIKIDGDYDPRYNPF